MAEQAKRKYDSTVARIAGNLLSGTRLHGIADDVPTDYDLRCVKWAVGMARAIVTEVERTEPARESL
jgi:hypothetical protein